MSIYGYNSAIVNGQNLTAGLPLVGAGGSNIGVSSGGGGGGITAVTSTDGCVDVQTTGSTVDISKPSLGFARWKAPNNAPLATYCVPNTPTPLQVPSNILQGSDYSSVTSGIQYTGSSTIDVTLTMSICVGRQKPQDCHLELGYQVNGTQNTNVASKGNLPRYRGTGVGQCCTLTFTTQQTLNTSDIITVSLIATSATSTAATLRVNSSDCFISLT